MSHTVLTYHLVFSTYRRHMVIDPHHERELYKCIFLFAIRKGVHIRRIGGMPDHVHILCDIPPTIAVANFVKTLKSETSKFMRINPHFPHWIGWSEGYGIFTVEAANREIRVRYIMNQKVHHSKLPFDQEYFNLLEEAGYQDNEK